MSSKDTSDNLLKNGLSSKIKLILLALFVATFAALVVWLRSVNGESYTVQQSKLLVAGLTRTYRLTLPKVSSGELPLVIAFHGIGDSADSMAQYSKLDSLAATNRFVLVIPDASNQMWKTIQPPDESHMDNIDFAFLDQLIAELHSTLAIDSSRIYLAGMSNGATFAQLYCAHRPGKFAALVTHSGTKPSEIDGAEWNTPIMLVCGLEDPSIAAIQRDYEWYRTTQQPVEFIQVPGLSHTWSATHNQLFWEFLSSQRIKMKATH